MAKARAFVSMRLSIQPCRVLSIPQAALLRGAQRHFPFPVGDIALRLHRVAVHFCRILGGGFREKDHIAKPSGRALLMFALRTVLVIDGARPGALPAEATQVALRYAQVNAHAISRILPDLVVLPLFGAGFDAIEALARLERFGFRGDVIVRTPDLPNSDIVERELSAVAPTLRVRLMGPTTRD
jgi:hypothetical protein